MALLAQNSFASDHLNGSYGNYFYQFVNQTSQCKPSILMSTLVVLNRERNVVAVDEECFLLSNSVFI